MSESLQNAIICRLVKEEEMPQVMQLWNTCFDDTIKFVVWYFARYWKAEYTIGVFEQIENEDVLQASAQVIPYNVNIRDISLSCGYIVGVDTAPQARNRGYAKHLLKECLKLQKERGQVMSLLMPFEGQFYYRYGWKYCYFHQRVVIDPKELSCSASAWGTIRKVDLYEAQKELQRVYETFIARYHGTVNRTEEQWKLQLEDAQMEHTICFIIEDEMNSAQGYFLWTPLKGKCFVREIAWCNERAKAGMFYYLMHNVAEGDKLWLELPEDDSLKYALATSKTDICLYPFLMARIVDVKCCLEAIRYPIESAELLLCVHDEFAEWNTGTYHVVIENGQAKISKRDILGVVSAETVKLLMVELSIDALSQLVMGAMDAEKLMIEERLFCQKESEKAVVTLLQRLWPRQNNYINEYY